MQKSQIMYKTEPSSKCEKIIAGLVTYTPDQSRFLAGIKRIYDQVDEIVIVDNGSNNYKILRESTEGFDKCHWISNNTNLGIAKGLNQVFKYARSRNIPWVLTLDDDSLCDRDMVQALYRFANKKMAGIICPGAVDNDCENREKPLTKPYYVEDCITAGSLTSVKAWEDIGGFDEKMFIDFVDIEFCTRLREAGYKIIRNPNTQIHQRFGDESKTTVFLGMKIQLYEYSSLRIYYSVRNQIYFMRKHWKTINMVYRIFFLFGYCNKRIVLGQNRKANINAMLKGLYDGFRL